MSAWLCQAQGIDIHVEHGSDAVDNKTIVRSLIQS